MRDLHALPKVELHIHLEGSVRVGTLRELAERGGGALPHGLLPDDDWRFEGFLDFIDNYIEACALLSTPEDFRRVAEEFCADLAANGVRYAEAVFSPSNHAARLGDWFGPIEAVLDGLEAGRRAHGVQVQLCPDLVRDNGPEDAERTLEVATKFAGRGVVALNAAGSERAPVAAFAPMFRRAKDAGLRSVPHAGEWAGPQNVWDTLAMYEPDRIGHGVRAIDDPRLVEELASIGIPLEVSPVSNVATGVYPSLAEHPFLRLREAGVVVTLNSDDPSMFGTWLGGVYDAARDGWGLTDAELAELARTGVAASFADAATKRSVLAGIDDWIAG
jgi:adenosine deaminase